MGQSSSLLPCGCCTDRSAGKLGDVTLSGGNGGNGGNRLLQQIEEEEAELKKQAKRVALAR